MDDLSDSSLDTAVNLPALRVAFVVQGEGRGHMTQALAVRDHLASAGHQVVGAFLGTSRYHATPSYFAAGLGAPVTAFTAPTLVPDAATQGMSIARTGVHSALMVPRYAAATLKLSFALKRLHADVVVNFFDLLMGFSRYFPPWSDPAPRVALAHAYLMGHPGAAKPPVGWGGKAGLRWLGWMAARGAGKPLALSFDPLPDTARVRVIPPLLRPGLDEMDVHDEGYLLAYALNRGYARDLAAWQAGRPEVPVHCYVAGGAGPDLPTQSGLQVHDLDDRAFLRHLAGCRAYVGTAGFEAVCEAHYLGKPILAVPVDHHYEQAFNAADIARAGVAQVGSFRDLGAFWEHLPVPDTQQVERFRAWVAQAPAMVVDAVEEAAWGARRWPD